MMLPKSVKVGNITFQVEMGLPVGWKHTHLGLSRLAEGMLYIEPTASPALQVETLLHEMIHMMLGNAGFHAENDNEPLICALANGMYQMLRDNDLAELIE